jgi:hypothetical protein
MEHGGQESNDDLSNENIDSSTLDSLDSVPVITSPNLSTANTSEDFRSKSEAQFLKPYHANRLLKSDPQLQSPDLLYDKVLVDAECTHDGSISHLLKCDRVGWENFENYFFNQDKMDDLEILQRKLILNGM